MKLVISGMDVLLSLSLRLFLSVSKDTAFEGSKILKHMTDKRMKKRGDPKSTGNLFGSPSVLPPRRLSISNALANNSKTGFTAFLATRNWPRVSKDSKQRVGGGSWSVYEKCINYRTPFAQCRQCVTTAHLSFAAPLVVVVA